MNNAIEDGELPAEFKFGVNENAYQTEESFLQLIDDLLFCRAHPQGAIQPKSAFIVDDCTAHKTPRVKARCRELNIDLVIIPGGLTSGQNADSHLNRPFKSGLGKRGLHIGINTINWLKGNLKPPVLISNTSFEGCQKSQV